MKSNSTRQRSGFALVMVLSILVLMTVLVVAFFSSVTTELSSTRIAAGGDASRRLADTTVQLVAAQVMDGTQSQTAGQGPLAWASQPGMIRTYQQDGSPGTFYKLYSSGSMSLPGAGFSVATDVPPSNWDSKPGVFIDLNSPVISNGIVNFPIIDPRAKTTSTATSVEGFDYGATVSGVVLPSGSPDTQRLPMPTQWLYQLQDGTLISPDVTASNATTIVFSGPAPTAANPIVGRIAFWTDDESSKVNINTASEGIFYDIPRFYSVDEYKLADRPPVIGEFQRYPGHPATTSLSTVLGPWVPMTSTAVEAASYSDIRKYFSLAPRINPDGGTRGGTTDSNNSGTALMPIKSNRLYASTDELLYSPDRAENLPEVTRDVLSRARFFLTTQSRSPDVNLFGRPRVSIWPVHQTNDALHRTVQDQLIAFASTVNGFPYYFQRGNPKSPTADYAGIQRNRELYAYLQRETSTDIPGFGGNFLTKFGADRDQVLTSIFDYIRSSNLNDPNTARPSQPEGGTYTEQLTRNNAYEWWTTNPDQDTRRSPGQVLPIQIGTTKGAGRFGVIDQALIVFHAPQAPTRLATPNTIRAYVSAYYLFSWYHPMLGAMNCLDLFKVQAEQTGPTLLTVTTSDPGVTVTLAAGDSGDLEMLKNQKQTLEAGYFARNATGGNGRSWGGMHGHSVFTDYRKSFFTSGKPAENFPFASGRFVAVDITDTNLPPVNADPEAEKRALDDVLGKVNFSFTGMKLDVGVFGQDNSQIQGYVFDFPGAGPLELPRARRTGTSPSETLYFTTFDQRFRSNAPGAATWLAPVTGGDVVRALLPSHTIGSKGDARLLAYTSTIPENWFSPHAKYSDTSTAMAHSLRTGVGNELWGAFASGKPGLLVAGLAPSNDISRPYIRTEINGVSRTDGGFADWDNGFGDRPDGAYLNKADEGIGPGSGGKPYFDWDGFQQQKNLTSPNRQIPSAVMFGSLPSGVKRGRAWETLLFRPDPTHPGAVPPPDYLLLDLFHMPIVEPYAISEPLSTAGRVNMNYQILPFSYITRSTGVQAVLKSERILAIPDSYTNYKTNWASPPSTRYRHAINMAETLKGFENRFASNDLFRSATEICSLHLVPDTGVTLAGMDAFWNVHRRTGDNTKERPYATIYPRLTTKSNTFTVHLRVQSLKKNPGTAANTWVEGRDMMTGEYRGSSTIERYVDASDPALPDFATDPNANLDPYYKFRIVNTKRFAP